MEGQNQNSSNQDAVAGKPVFIYGFHSVESAVVHDAKNVICVWLENGRKDKRARDIISLIEKNNLKYEFASRDFLDKKSDNGRHQGIVAEYLNSSGNIKLNLSDILKRESVFLLVLDGVQDPHNLGACLRSANAVGVDAVIAPKDRAVGITPTVSRIACGAAESTPFIQVTNLSQTLQMLKDADVWCVGLAGEAEKEIYDADFTGRIAVVVGAEENGLRRLTRENCDYLVRIPMEGDVESLNVSVATGIALFEALRQRRNHP